jgi:S-adenosyl methyltransferase
MQRPNWVSADIDLERPSGARVCDYFLGGAHNFAVDRELAEIVSRMTPDVGDAIRANRAFLRRAVRYMVDQGIHQFLDLGSGIPTLGNVHEVAQRADPTARVVYVDIDPVAVSHSRMILDGDPRTAVVQADAREFESILAAPETRRLLDLEQPVGVLILGLLHFIPDADDPAGIVKRVREAICPGSFVALANVTYEDQSPEVIEAQKLSNQIDTPICLRSRRELLEQFDGLSLVEPGLVHIPLWRPDSPLYMDEHPERFGVLGGVGRKDPEENPNETAHEARRPLGGAAAEN